MLGHTPRASKGWDSDDEDEDKENPGGLKSNYRGKRLQAAEIKDILLGVGIAVRDRATMDTLVYEYKVEEPELQNIINITTLLGRKLVTQQILTYHEMYKVSKKQRE